MSGNHIATIAFDFDDDEKTMMATAFGLDGKELVGHLTSASTHDEGQQKCLSYLSALFNGEVYSCK